ncbi:MAG: GntR family transcriptional regulator [Longimicrobiales bacterium]
MQIRLDPADTRPLYVQIMDAVRSALVRGTVEPGDPLPSVREVASGLRVNPRTVSQAYSELEREGLVRVQPGRGTFVAPGARPDRTARPHLAREVARRALADASRNGLVLRDLLDALHHLADDPEETP